MTRIQGAKFEDMLFLVKIANKGTSLNSIESLDGGSVLLMFRHFDILKFMTDVVAMFEAGYVNYITKLFGC